MPLIEAIKSRIETNQNDSLFIKNIKTKLRDDFEKRFVDTYLNNEMTRQLLSISCYLDSRFKDFHFYNQKMESIEK